MGTAWYVLIGLKKCVRSVQEVTKCQWRCFLHNYLADRRLSTFRFTSSLAPGQARKKEAAVCRQIKGQRAPQLYALHWYQISSNSSQKKPSLFLRHSTFSLSTVCCTLIRACVWSTGYNGVLVKGALCCRLLSCRQWLKIVRNFRQLAP
jgi:hypothetical protein